MKSAAKHPNLSKRGLNWVPAASISKQPNMAIYQKQMANIHDLFDVPWSDLYNRDKHGHIRPVVWFVTMAVTSPGFGNLLLKCKVGS